MSSRAISVTFSDVLDASSGALDEQFTGFFDPGEELTYEVRMPTAPERAGSPGIFTYISPKEGARVPDGWAAALDAHNLVWVGARNSGNEVHVARRVGLALLAPTVAANVGEVDQTRHLLAGFSGGGRVASMVVPAYPDRFVGAMFICGANGLFAGPPIDIERLRQCPMVFLTGTGDFNRDDTRMAISTFHRMGVASAKLTVVADLGHALPSGQEFSNALQALHASEV